jgi:hypothetical protein
VAEVDFTRAGWAAAEGLDVRVVATRTRGERSGTQVFLWQGLEFTTQIFLTNDHDIAAEDLAFEYNARAGIEPVIGELKNGWGLGKVPSKVFDANHAAMLIKLLSYNLMRRYAAATCPPELHRWRSTWLRRALIWTPGRLVRSGPMLVVANARAYAEQAAALSADTSPSPTRAASSTGPSARSLTLK